MIESTRLSNGFIKLTATAGLIHNLRTDEYRPSFVMLTSDTIDMYEEVAEKPAFTKEQYDAKVAELVRLRYTESEEFAIQRKAINAAFSPTIADSAAMDTMEEYRKYNAYVEQCKQQAKDPELYKTENEV